MNVNITVKGDRAIAYRFGRTIPEAIHEHLVAKIRDLTMRLLARVKSREPVNTGRLQSRTRATFVDREDLISGKVRVGGSIQDKLKALTLEFGGGKEGSRRGGIAAVHAYTRGADIAVRAYKRHINIAEHRFLRDEFDALTPDAEREIRRAFMSAADE